MNATTATAVRYTVEKDDNGWAVVGSDGTFEPVASRQAGRELAKQLREGIAPEVGEGGPVNTFTDPQGEDLPEVEDDVTVTRDTCSECGGDLVRHEDGSWGHVDPALDGHPEQAARDEADRQADELAAEHAAVDNDNAAQAAADAERQAKVEAPRVKAPNAAKTTLARVQVGDELMTNLHTDGEGKVWAEPHRFSDGQVRRVAEVTTRKAEGSEMPGTLYTLVFEDGTCTVERYGTTSHYLAAAFTGEVAPAPALAPAGPQVTGDEVECPACHSTGPDCATPSGRKAAQWHEARNLAKKAPAEKPAKKAAAPKAPKAEKVATTPSRAGKLAKGDRLVLRDLGVVTVDQVSKTGEGKLEVAYTQADGEAGVREMWGSTNVRIAAE